MGLWLGVLAGALEKDRKEAERIRERDRDINALVRAQAEQRQKEDRLYMRNERRRQMGLPPVY